MSAAEIVFLIVYFTIWTIIDMPAYLAARLFGRGPYAPYFPRWRLDTLFG